MAVSSTAAPIAVAPARRGGIPLVLSPAGRSRVRTGGGMPDPPHPGEPMKLKPLAAAMTLAALCAGAQAGQNVTVKILSFNDFHGNLVSPGTYRSNVDAPAVPAGGRDQPAGYLAAARGTNPRPGGGGPRDELGARPPGSARFPRGPQDQNNN